MISILLFVSLNLNAEITGSAFDDLVTDKFFTHHYNRIFNDPNSNYCPPIKATSTIDPSEYLKDYNTNEVGELSLLSEDQLQQAFDKINNSKHIPFKFNFDGCRYRAHEMAKVLEDQGILSGKIFIGDKGGHLRIKNDYKEEMIAKGLLDKSENPNIFYESHTAVFVMVRDGSGDIKPMVIDPSTFSRPVSIKTFKGTLRTRGTFEPEIQLFNRFQLTGRKYKGEYKKHWHYADINATKTALENLRLAEKAFINKKCGEVSNKMNHGYSSDASSKKAKGLCERQYK